jgi:hypothetical protein
MIDETKPIGLTKDTGWQIGLRRTLDVDSQWLWNFLWTTKGVHYWLGPGEPFAFSEGEAYELDDGTIGVLKVLKPNSHWRITRYPIDPAYDRPSTMQVRVIPKDNKTILAFHEEHLPTEGQRRARKAHYLKVVDQLLQEIKNA